MKKFAAVFLVMIVLASCSTKRHKNNNGDIHFIEFRLVTEKAGSMSVPFKDRSTGSNILVGQKVLLNRNDIQSATKDKNGYGQYQILLQFNPSGADTFRTITAANHNRKLAIIINNEIIISPIIKETIACGRASVSGSLTEKEIDEIVDEINR